LKLLFFNTSGVVIILPPLTMDVTMAIGLAALRAGEPLNNYQLTSD
jgi:hypothetical protein